MDRDALYAFMSRERYGVVSTAADDGTPQSALVGIAVAPDLRVIFDTVTSSRKYANLQARPRCSFVIGWAGEQTLQFEGDASEPDGAELDDCKRVYVSVWPDAPARASWPGLTYFVVRPRWIRYSDFDARPPVIAESRFG